VDPTITSLPEMDCSPTSEEWIPNHKDTDLFSLGTPGLNARETRTSNVSQSPHSPLNPFLTIDEAAADPAAKAANMGFPELERFVKGSTLIF